MEEKQKIMGASVKSMESLASENQQQIAKEEEEIAQIEEFLLKCRSDLDIQIRIKQGQVEVNNEKPIPDLEDALLLSRSEIDEKNVKIRK